MSSKSGAAKRIRSFLSPQLKPKCDNSGRFLYAMTVPLCQVKPKAFMIALEQGNRMEMADPNQASPNVAER